MTRLSLGEAHARPSLVHPYTPFTVHQLASTGQGAVSVGLQERGHEDMTESKGSIDTERPCGGWTVQHFRQGKHMLICHE